MATIAEADLPIMPTVPMPKGIFEDMEKDFAKAFGGQGEDQPTSFKKYESIVDDFLKDQGLKPGETFRVLHPEGPRFYEVLPENSGARKDWRQIKKEPSPLVS